MRNLSRLTRGWEYPKIVFFGAGGINHTNFPSVYLGIIFKFGFSFETGCLDGVDKHDC